MAHTYIDIAGVFGSQGKLDDAIVLYREALEIYKKDLGEDHTSVANSYNGTGNALKAQGMLDDAMELYRMALKIR